MSDEQLHYRSIGIRIRGDQPSTFDRETRSVDITLSTEEPVMVWGEREILLSDGARIPKDKKIVMLDTHNRFTVDGVLGSIRKLHKANGEVVGTAFFSKRVKAEDAFTMIEEGHLTDFSVGYKVNKYVRVADKETQTIKGREFKGPVLVVTDWTPREGSVAPVGADPNSKVRSQGGQKMPEIIEAKETEITAAVEAERDRIGEITAMCEQLGCPHLSRDMIAKGTSLEDAKVRVCDWMAAQDEPVVPVRMHPGRVESGLTAEEKRRDAQIGGILLRAGGVAENDLPPGSRQYAGESLISIARECCRAAGDRVKNLSPTRILERAMTTADFPYILGTSQEKMLQAGYEEAGTTWQIWARSRPVENFKTQKRPQLSEFDNLDEIPEHGDYKYGDPSEFQEEYQIATYGKLLALTRQTIVNDDLAAFARIARGHGAAAARLVNETVYAVLTANSNMSDGVALFHANHSNLGTAGAPSETTLTEMLKMIRIQTGPKGSVLGIRPKYVIGPAAHEAVIYKSIRSISLDSANPAIVNIFSEIGLIPVVEALLDSDSATAWYAAADNIDTVEVGFLNGVERPYLEQRQGWTVDGVEYKVRIDVGAKALDYRGLFKNAGA